VLRYGVPEAQGRGADLLPPDVSLSFVDIPVRSTDFAELARAFRTAPEALAFEIGQADPGLAARLSGLLRELGRV
jgi:hypothetical protein